MKLRVKYINIFGLILLIAFTVQKGRGETPPVKNTANGELLYSFAVVGCNRLDKADTNTALNPSTANVEQLLQTFKDIENLNPRPKLFFFAGDLVMGYAGDSARLGSQLRAWRKLYENSGLSKTDTKLIVTPGNHESMVKKGGHATKEMEESWTNNMAPYILNNNGPGKGGADSLQTDQSKLTYSFDYKNSHFIVLNTDPAGKEARVPSEWIQSDITKYGKGKEVFAIGHKPGYSAPDEKGLDEYLPERDKFWSVLENGGCKAMITAHNHLYYCVQPHLNKTWQVVAGHGGSPLAKGLAPQNTFFGFVVVSVYKNGKILVQCYGRDLPKEGYMAPVGNTKTTIRDQFEITN